MDIKYLTEVIIPQREKEIEERKNLMTAQPIYVVLDLKEQVSSGHNDFCINTNYKGKEKEYGFVDMELESEEREFSVTSDGMKKPEEVTRFFIDNIEAFFFTSKAAHDYLNYQAHNLTDPYVYVFSTGYGNREMDKLLQGK